MLRPPSLLLSTVCRSSIRVWIVIRCHRCALCNLRASLTVALLCVCVCVCCSVCPRVCSGDQRKNVYEFLTKCNILGKNDVKVHGF